MNLAFLKIQENCFKPFIYVNSRKVNKLIIFKKQLLFKTAARSNCWKIQTQAMSSRLLYRWIRLKKIKRKNDQNFCSKFNLTLPGSLFSVNFFYLLPAREFDWRGWESWMRFHENFRRPCSSNI